MLRDELRRAVLAKGDKLSTFDAYWPHVKSFVTFVRRKHGRDITRNDVTSADAYAYRDYLANDLRLSPSSCNQRISAIKFLFLHVIGSPVVEIEGNPLRLRETKHRRRRMISEQDMRSFFTALRPRDRLIAQLQYAGFMRLDDVMNTRIKDYNFDDEQIEIADTKTNHFRILPFPRSLHDAVRSHIESVKVLHKFDATHNPNGVPVPYAYDRKRKSAPREFGWYWMFPSDNLSRDPKDGRIKRYHLDKGNISKNYAKAVRRARLNRKITPHGVRRAAATHAHLRGMPLVKLQGFLGHSSIEQTREYIMEDESQIKGSDSPFDDLMTG